MPIFDQSILSLPLFDDAHRRLAEEVEAWVADHGGVAADATDAVAKGRDLVRLLGRDGWFEHVVGGGLRTADGSPDFRAVCLIREGFAYLDDLCDFAFSIQGLACAPFVFYGSEAQKRQYLPDMTAGRRIGSLAISEPEVGSDVATLTTSAVRDGSNFVLNGEKTWTSHGNIADHHCVLARTGEGPGAMGLSWIVVPADTPGVAIRSNIELTAPRPFAAISFTDCVVSQENLIGKAGMGFRYAMEILERYRITVGSTAIGFCRRAVDAALPWAKTRPIQGVSLFDMQMTKDKFADMAVFLDAASLLVARAAWELDMGMKRISKHSSIAKLYATEHAQRVIDDALQMFGAAGVVKNAPLEKLYREIRSLRIYEGTSEIQRLIIAGALARN